MTAAKSEATANTNHPFRARFDLRHIINQALILRQDHQCLFITTLTAFRQRHPARRALKLPVWTISTST